MLETFGWRYHSNSNFNVDSVLTCKWSNGIMAYRWVLWKRKGCWWWILPAMAQRKFPSPCLVWVQLIFNSHFFFRFWKTILAFLTIGLTSLPGLLLHVNWLPQFSYPDLLCVFEVNEKRKNNWTCNIWCLSIHKSSHHTLILHTHNKFIHNRLSMGHNMDQRQDITTIEGPLFECFCTSFRNLIRCLVFIIDLEKRFITWIFTKKSFYSV